MYDQKKHEMRVVGSYWVQADVEYHILYIKINFSHRYIYRLQFLINVRNNLHVKCKTFT